MTDFEKYVGIPFRDHGRDAGGCDCWGLVRLVYREQFGIELSDIGPLYRDTRDIGGMVQVYYDQAPKWDEVKAPGAGDVVLLNVMNAPVHVGVVIAPGLMLHVERGLDAVVERFDGSVWKNRVRGFYRSRSLNLKSLGIGRPI